MKIIIRIILAVLILFFIEYKTNKLKKEYEKRIINLKNQNQKLRYSLDSLRVILFKRTSSEINKKEIRDYIKSFLAKQNDKFIPDIYPVGGQFVISQKFSLKHPAVDFAAETGTKVIATASGKVDTTYFDKYFGNTIILNHLNGYKTKYSHLAKILVQKNYFVEKKTVIGLVGNTGRSSAPHLHYEIMKENKNINPLKLIKGNK